MADDHGVVGPLVDGLCKRRRRIEGFDSADLLDALTVANRFCQQFRGLLGPFLAAVKDSSDSYPGLTKERGDPLDVGAPLITERAIGVHSLRDSLAVSCQIELHYGRLWRSSLPRFRQWGSETPLSSPS